MSKRKTTSLVGAVLGALIAMTCDSALAAPTLVGSVGVSSESAIQAAVNPNTDTVYVAGPFAQPGLRVVNASNPAAPSLTTDLFQGQGGVAVDPSTGHFFAADGYGDHILTFDGLTNTVIHSTSATGCGGVFDFDPSHNAVAEITQCQDSLNVLDSTTNTLSGSVPFCCAVGELVRVNSATGREYAASYGNPTKVYGPPPTMTPLGTLPGTIVAVNPVTNRLYFWPGGSSHDLTVLDGTSNATLGTVTGGVGTGGVYRVGAVDTVADRVYVVDETTRQVVETDGATNTVLATIALPGGLPSDAVAVDSSKHRLYIVGGNDPGAKTLFVYSDPYDTTPPDTSIDSQPPSKTNSTSASFTFSATDPDDSSGFTFKCQLDGASLTPCTSPQSYSGLAEGNHTFSVAASDPAGNSDPTPASYTWMVDLTPPQITITTPAAREHFTLDQGVTPVYACNDPVSNGVASGIASCTATPIDTATLGPHLFTVTAVDQAGNSSTLTNAYVVDPPRYGDFVMADHPLAYYRLDETLGATTMIDSSGNGHHGTFMNGVVLRRDPAPTCERRPHPPQACDLNADPQGWAAYFPPRDGYGYVNGITAPTTAYSLEAWVKPADSGDMMIAAHGGGGQLFISGGHAAFRQTQDTIYGGGPVLTPGQWWHVAASWDGHTSRLYVNGVQVAFSTTANKPPSGTSTFYVGYGDQAPWMHGTLDEVAYYDHALDGDQFADHYEIGTAFDHPSLGTGLLDTAKPFADIRTPVNGGTYAPTKVPNADFSCTDPDGPGDVVSCTATVDGNPINSGDPLPNGLGSHSLTVTATDAGGLVYVHTHSYTVEPYPDVVLSDSPLAYYRLGDAANSSTMSDETGAHNGVYMNDQTQGLPGISGDGNSTRQFLGHGGYGYVNGVTVPHDSYTVEAWVKPDDNGDMMILQFNDAGALSIHNGHFVFRQTDQDITDPGSVVAGHWHHVVGVWDGQTATLYVDGQAVASHESTTRPVGASTMYVGYGDLAPWARGELDEVAYFPTALSAERVYEHYIADPPPGDSSTTSASSSSASPPAVWSPPAPQGASAPAPSGPAAKALAPAKLAPTKAKSKSKSKSKLKVKAVAHKKHAARRARRARHH